MSEAAAAPDGALPMWGQKGTFVLRVGLTRIRFKVDGIFGIWNAFNFSIHAVDWHKNFPSETGYRSFCGVSIENIPQGWSVADWLIATVKAHIAKEYKKGLPFIGMDYQERHGHEVCELPTVGGDHITDANFKPVKYQPEPYMVQKEKHYSTGPATQLSLFGGAA